MEPVQWRSAAPHPRLPQARREALPLAVCKDLQRAIGTPDSSLLRHAASLPRSTYTVIHGTWTGGAVQNRYAHFRGVFTGIRGRGGGVPRRRSRFLTLLKESIPPVDPRRAPWALAQPLPGRLSWRPRAVTGHGRPTVERDEDTRSLSPPSHGGWHRTWRCLATPSFNWAARADRVYAVEGDVALVPTPDPAA